MADNQLERMSHDLNFECKSPEGDEYSCQVEGYTEEGELVSERLVGVQSFKTDGDTTGINHSIRGAGASIRFSSFSDCFYDPSYGGPTVYCGDRHP